MVEYNDNKLNNRVTNNNNNNNNNNFSKKITASADKTAQMVNFTRKPSLNSSKGIEDLNNFGMDYFSLAPDSEQETDNLFVPDSQDFSSNPLINTHSGFNLPSPDEFTVPEIPIDNGFANNNSLETSPGFSSFESNLYPPPPPTPFHGSMKDHLNNRNGFADSTQEMIHTSSILNEELQNSMQELSACMQLISNADFSNVKMQEEVSDHSTDASLENSPSPFIDDNSFDQEVSTLPEINSKQQYKSPQNNSSQSTPTPIGKNTGKVKKSRGRPRKDPNSCSTNSSKKAGSKKLKKNKLNQANFKTVVATGDGEKDPAHDPQIAPVIEVVTAPNYNPQKPRKKPEIVSKNPNTPPEKKRKGKYADLTPEEKLALKREKNKEAAARYRLKNREMSETIVESYDDLKLENVALRAKISSVRKDIDFLKQLLGKAGVNVSQELNKNR